MSQVSLNCISAGKVFPRDQKHRPLYINISPDIEEKRRRVAEPEINSFLTKMRGGYYEGIYAEAVRNRYPQTKGIITSHEISIRNGKVFVQVTFDNGQVLNNQNPGNLTLLLRRVDV